MTSTWQQQIKSTSDPDLWNELRHKLDKSLDPSIHQQGLIEQFYLPLFFYLHEQSRRKNQPGFIVGLNAPQGGGKSTLSSYLVKMFEWSGLHAVTLSIDDFYLPRQDQVRLASENPDNPYLQQRGYPGTHDIALGADILFHLKQFESDHTLSLPRYDKSKHNGQGDRAEPALWSTVPLPVDVVLFEGWMLGFQTLPPDRISDKHLQKINTLLKQYADWHSLLDCFVSLCPEDPVYVIDWRSEAEERMKARGLSGMSASEVRAYAEKFLPAYRLYSPHLSSHPPTPDAYLNICIGKNRLPV